MARLGPGPVPIGGIKTGMADDGSKRSRRRSR